MNTKKNVLIISCQRSNEVEKITGGVDKYLKELSVGLSKNFNFKYMSLSDVWKTASKKELARAALHGGQFKDLKILDDYDVILNNTIEHIDKVHS